MHVKYMQIDTCKKNIKTEIVKICKGFKNINVGIQFNDKQYSQKQVHFCGK